jgi:hypothetical protein
VFGHRQLKLRAGGCALFLAGIGCKWEMIDTPAREDAGAPFMTGAAHRRSGFNILLNPAFHSANTELIGCLVIWAVIHSSLALHLVITACV